ncbi:MAG: fimbrial protein [Neisseria sp.]|nr:fimbrial protein [Neisseria sp.]
MKHTSKWALLIAAATLSAGVMAKDGTVTINGEVVSQTCTVDAGSVNKTVTLPKVPTTALPTAGTTAGDTPFSLVFNNCSVGDVYAYFLPGANTVAATGNLKNNGVATNVEIALYNTDDSKIKLNDPAATQNSASVNVGTAGGTATLNYVAKYYATGQATVGAVTTSVDYNIAYK